MSETTKDQATFKRNATEKGFEVIEPESNLLLLDLDDSFHELKKRAKLLADMIPIESIKYKPSKTRGHYHAIVKLGRDVDFSKRQLLELMLGSDPCRAIHNFRHKAANSPYPELLSTVAGPWRELAFRD